MSANKQKPRGMPKSVTQGVRILGKTSGRTSSLYASDKADGISAPDSPLERTVGQLASLDPRVESIKCQPFTVDVVSGRLLHTRDELVAHRKTREKSDVKLREYTPDLLIRLMSGTRLVVEVKDERFMSDDAYWAKVRKAEVILRTNGYEFLVITMVYEPSHPLVQNADLLMAFSKNYRGDISSGQIGILEQMLEGQSLELGEVCLRLNLSLRESPALLLYGHICTDLKASRLCAKSLAQLAYGDLSHLELLPLDSELI